jgi:nucleotide-binding universal stress UspA family protein
MQQQMKQYHEEIAKRYASQLGEANGTVRAEVVTDDPRSGIVAAAARQDIDLIIMGSHGRTGLRKLLLGSVSSYVVAHAPCSVLLVKLPE